MKRLPLVVLGALALALAACGDDGGGGDEEAFCDSLESLSDQVADGDLADDDGLEDVTDTVNELLESAADGEQLDAVNAVGDEVEGADADDADATAETIQDELGDFAEDCDIESDEFAVGPEVEETTTTTTEPEDDETTTTTAVDGETTLPPEGDAPVVRAREPVPGDIAAEFAGLAQGCFDGDMAQCDELFATTPPDTIDETYGDTCAGRLDDGLRFDLECASVITGPVDVPAEVVDQATAAACQAGDMVACDDLFQNSADGSVDESYGALCAGRVQSTDALCVDIFGEVAFA